MTRAVKLSGAALLACTMATAVFAQDEPVPAPAYPSSDAAGPRTVQTAQPQTTTPDGWRRLAQNQAPQNGPAQRDPNQPYYGQQGPPANYQPPPPVPAQMTIQPGTYFTVRINQALSTDHNQQGDAFTATLVKPIVVDGFVVADRGQTIAGRVSESDKGGRVKGVSRLGVELTELALIDGQQVPVRSQLVARTAGTSDGRDAGAIGTTTAVGAIAGAAADAGRGAVIGAGAGAAAGVIGVLLTRGRPSVIYPEMILTFRVEAPIAFSTARAPQAFRLVGPGDYDQPQDQPRLAQRPAPRSVYGPVYGPGWGYPYDPYFYGPRIGIGFGGYYGGRYGGHYGGGFGGGRHR